MAEREKGVFMPDPIAVDNTLTWQERVFLGEIIYFHRYGEKGCVLSNGYLARKYKLDKSNIAHVFTSLQKKKQITCELVWQNGKIVGRRTKPAFCTNESSVNFTVGVKNTPGVVCKLHPKEEYKEEKKETDKEKPVLEDKTFSKDSTQNTQEISFEIFWQAYPKKVARKEALKSWQKLSPDQLLVDEIMLALEKHKAQEFWHKENGRYIPKPSTWLSDERWTDEIDVTQEYTTRDLTEAEADALMEQINADR